MTSPLKLLRAYDLGAAINEADHALRLLQCAKADLECSPVLERQLDSARAFIKQAGEASERAVGRCRDAYRDAMDATAEQCPHESKARLASGVVVCCVCERELPETRS